MIIVVDKTLINTDHIALAQPIDDETCLVVLSSGKHYKLLCTTEDIYDQILIEEIEEEEDE